jgi:hypothetical protein
MFEYGGTFGRKAVDRESSDIREEITSRMCAERSKWSWSFGNTHPYMRMAGWAFTTVLCSPRPGDSSNDTRRSSGHGR